MSEVINHLNWRYATKKFDPSKKLDEEKLNRILEAIRLTPTSSGLQPFEVFVVKNEGLRARIREVAWNQAQVTEASHLLVFAAWDNITPARIISCRIASDGSSAGTARPSMPSGTISTAQTIARTRFVATPASETMMSPRR